MLLISDPNHQFHNTPPSHSHSYSAERSDLALTLPNCKSTCRALEFSGDGGQLFSGWADGSLRIHSMETGALKRRLTAAHSTGVYSVLPLTKRIMASGDDDGTVKCEERAGWGQRELPVNELGKDTWGGGGAVGSKRHRQTLDGWRTGVDSVGDRAKWET